MRWVETRAGRAQPDIHSHSGKEKRPLVAYRKNSGRGEHCQTHQTLKLTLETLFQVFKKFSRPHAKATSISNLPGRSHLHAVHPEVLGAAARRFERGSPTGQLRLTDVLQDPGICNAGRTKTEPSERGGGAVFSWSCSSQADQVSIEDLDVIGLHPTRWTVSALGEQKEDRSARDPGGHRCGSKGTTRTSRSSSTTELTKKFG